MNQPATTGKSRSLRLVVTLTLSYFFVFLVPVAAMLMYYYPLTNRTISQRETDWTQYSIDQVRQTLDGVLTYIYDLPADLQNDQDLYLGSPADDWGRWATTREFRKHAKSDRFIYDTFLYLARDTYLYSVAGTAGPASAVFQPETGYYYPLWPTEELLKDLSAPQGISIRAAEEIVVPEKNRQRIISFLVPVPLNSRHPVGTLLVLVREEPILDLIRPIAERNGGEVWIADAKKTLILGVGTDGRPLTAVPDTDTLVSRSTVSDWVISSRDPGTSQPAEIQEVQTSTLAISFGVLLAGALIIAWAVRFHYLPVKMLAQFARTSLPQASSGGENEWETIRGSLSTLRQASTHVRRDLLAKLVAGDFASREAFHALARPFGLSLDHSLLTMGLVAVDPHSTVPLDPEGVLHRQTGDGAYWIFEDTASDDRILLFCHKNYGFPQECLSQDFAVWERHTNVRTVVGIGSTTTDSLELRSSLGEARRVADLLFLNQTTRWGDLGVTDTSFGIEPNFPSESVQVLETVVRGDDSKAICRITGELIERLGDSNLGLAMTRALWLSLVGILKEGQRHHGLPLVHHGDSAHLGCDRATRSQLVQHVSQELEILCKAVSHEQGAKSEHERQRIFAYFQGRDSLSETVASLKDVSEAFGMSESGFSRYFRRLVGGSFRDFIDQKKIDLSKRLLSETDDPVELIGQRVGYAPSNSSSFIRSFKRCVGMTPGQFRQQQNLKVTSGQRTPG